MDNRIVATARMKRSIRPCAPVTPSSAVLRPLINLGDRIEGEARDVGSVLHMGSWRCVHVQER
jgi:glycerate-2-kinase